MAEDKFKLPRSSYEELCKIIKAYARSDQPTSLDDMAKLCAINKTVISANNSFLTNVDLIEGGRAKTATSQGHNLAKALEHELPEPIQECWAAVVNGSDFLEKMSAAVKVRGKMEVSALESHVAYSAGEAKSPQVMTGARAVLDILRAADVIREQDGQLIAGVDSLISKPLYATEESSRSSSPSQYEQVVSSDPVKHQMHGSSLHIELRIEAKPSELEGLGEKIRKLVQEIESPPQVEASEEAQD